MQSCSLLTEAKSAMSSEGWSHTHNVCRTFLQCIIVVPQSPAFFMSWKNSHFTFTKSKLLFIFLMEMLRFGFWGWGGFFSVFSFYNHVSVLQSWRWSMNTNWTFQYSWGKTFFKKLYYLFSEQIRSRNSLLALLMNQFKSIIILKWNYSWNI